MRVVITALLAMGIQTAAWATDITVLQLKASESNGSYLWGAALPGTHGIALQKTFSQRSQITGKICQLMDYRNGYFGALKASTGEIKTAAIGSHYGLFHHLFPADSIDSVIRWSVVVRNARKTPDLLMLSCLTDRNFSLTIGEIEADLGNAIHFYESK